MKILRHKNLNLLIIIANLNMLGCESKEERQTEFLEQRKMESRIIAFEGWSKVYLKEAMDITNSPEAASEYLLKHAQSAPAFQFLAQSEVLVRIGKDVNSSVVVAISNDGLFVLKDGRVNYYPSTTKE